MTPDHRLPLTARPYRRWLKAQPANRRFLVMAPHLCPLARWLESRVPAGVKVRVGGHDYNLNGKNFKFPDWMCSELGHILNISRGSEPRRVTATQLRKHLETV
jgi:hypothetical protein